MSKHLMAKPFAFLVPFESNEAESQFCHKIAGLQDVECSIWLAENSC